jgi:uncharacterized membrane protein (UPF0182 family)
MVRWMLAILVALAVLWWLPGLLHLYTEWLWFKFDVSFPGVFWTLLGTRLGLGLVFGAVFLVFLLANVELARRLARRTVWYDEERALRQRIAEVMEYFAGRYLYLALAALAVVVAYGVGVGAADQWNKYLLFRHAADFGVKDPIFGRDVGFYVFRLPFWHYLWRYAYGLLIAVLVVSAAAHYLDKAIRVLRGVPAFAPHVKTHLSVLLTLILVAKAFDYWLERYYLLYSDRGATFGASYADVNAQLLAYNVLFVIALVCAALVFANIRMRGLWLPLAGIGFLALSSLLLNATYPALVQRFHVVPNEFEREKEYIGHTIDFTRQGFGLDRVELRQLDRLGDLNMGAVADNLATVENVRLWDYRPLLDTYQNQQAIWDYYRFFSVDIDRYRINDRYRQVMLSARELDQGRLLRILPQKTWQNEYVFYTHGCGVVMSPVSDAVRSGLPHYVVKNIPPESSFDLDVTQHGVYYGELTNDYVIVGTTEEENDYTLRETNQVAKTRYSGEGGVPIGSALARLATAMRFRDINILISTIVTKDSRIMWGRNVAWRSKNIAPFLSYDRDPYIVVGTDGRLYWIQDAYTTSDMYPYSERFRNGGGSFNYVRNSVKVVTDAYDGTVVFYVADAEDPIVRAYQAIFPELFRPMAEMPAGLLAHIRYPEALFNTQAARLTVYHMTDARVFYNRIEKWEIAREHPKSVGPGAMYGAPRGDSQGEIMEAYYAILRLPGEEEPEFLLMLPFTPQGRPNMVAWLAGRCDGEDYGKLLLYNFPKTEQIWGPIQIEASIDQDPAISEKISLWNQQGSSVIRGNLLVIPLDNSILYVEPIYLKATQSPFPELKQVVVARGDGSVAMSETLSSALAKLLGEAAPKLAVLEPTGPRRAAVEQVAPAPEEEEAVAPEPPAPLAGDAYGLAQRADRLLKQALDQQRKGDWAGYGESLKQLQETLNELTEKTKP